MDAPWFIVLSAFVSSRIPHQCTCERISLGSIDPTSSAPSCESVHTTCCTSLRISRRPCARTGEHTLQRATCDYTASCHVRQIAGRVHGSGPRRHFRAQRERSQWGPPATSATFSELAKPLTNLTKKGIDWRWESAEETAFLKLKTAMATAPVLQLPDFDKPFVLTTDASNAALGAILEQDLGQGLRPVAYASRKLNHAKSRYSTYERELLGIVWAIAQWKHYFQGPHMLVVQTDHAPLRHLPNQASVNSRVWKWINILQGYDLELRHIPGKKNPADSLSRQHFADACKQRIEVKEEKKDLVSVLRIKPQATNEDIQNALSRIFASKETESDAVSIINADQAQD